MLDELKKDLKRFADKDRAKHSAGFFKTGKGEYGEGDKFLGVSTPDSRKIAKKYKNMELAGLQKLLRSQYHEERFVALVILTQKYKRGDQEKKKKIYNFYLNNTKHINNWDLVDVSAYKILGDYLLNKDRKVLYSLTSSSSLWERRIAVIATFQFIRNNEFGDTLKISRRLLKDNEDLVHKAVGWMLREVGKRDKAVLDKFLLQNHKIMPRTMLRYAIEKHPQQERQEYLLG